MKSNTPHITRISSNDDTQTKKSKKKSINKDLIKLLVKIFAVFLLLFVLFSIVYSADSEEQKRASMEASIKWRQREDNLNYVAREGIVKDRNYKITVSYFENNIETTTDGYGLFRIKHTITNLSQEAQEYSYCTGSFSIECGTIEYSINEEDKSNLLKNIDMPKPKIDCDFYPEESGNEQKLTILPGESKEMISCGWIPEKAYNAKYVYVGEVGQYDASVEETLLTLEL